MKKLPMKYFAGCIAKIYYRKVDKWAEMHARNGIEHYFDTWKEAHDFMIADAKKNIEHLERDLKSEKRHLEKVLKMEENVQKQDNL